VDAKERKPIFLTGVLDQSFNPDGFFTLPSDEDCKDEILRVKRLGLNTARIHIKAEEPLKLYWADRLGVLIMADIPNFWGQPTEETKVQYVREMDEQIIRDRNHPSIFYWVLFNETWGLHTAITDENGKKRNVYLPETAKWVVSCYERVKMLDPTRLVEDHSPCNCDHTVTDVSSWHFYANSYNYVKELMGIFSNGAYPGSNHNFKEGYKMGDIPFLNSECGNFWGVDGNAGSSDISWHYKFMMNEFRVHEKHCGFVFTELHDVVNEFNGHYKIDNTDKDFGLEAYGMSLYDLHSQDYLGIDYRPMTTVKPGNNVTLSLFGSSFSDKYHGKVLEVVWQTAYLDPVTEETIISDCGSYNILWEDYGKFSAGVISTVMPDTDGIVNVSFALCDNGKTVMRNFILFDVDGIRDDVLTVEPREFKTSGFDLVIPAIASSKLSGLGSGEMTAEIDTSAIPGLCNANNLRVVFEASTRPGMTHDYPIKKCEKKDIDYLRGQECNPEDNPNTFHQTDEYVHPGVIEVLIDGEACGIVSLPDSPADSRGALSHHYQESDRLLNEAGSYGYLCNIKVPSRILIKLIEKQKFSLTIRTLSDSGLSLYGRRSGRYGIGVIIKAD